MLHCWLPVNPHRDERALIYPKGATYKVRNKYLNWNLGYNIATKFIFQSKMQKMFISNF
jgi:hypothetical protein